MTDDSAMIWLAVIAVSLAVVAIGQLAMLVVSIRLIRQVTTTVEALGTEIRPLVEKLNRIADEAGRAVSLASLQVERVDHVLSATAARVDEAATVLRAAMGGPIQKGAAALMVIRAVVSAFRRGPAPSGAGSRREDDDALFVG